MGDSAASSIKTPTEITDKNIRGKVKDIFVGPSGLQSTSIFILTTDNKLFGLGDNQLGQLGLGELEAVKKPTLIDFDFL